MAQKLESRLGLMMFLEYVIWGSWLPLIALYLSQCLHFSGADIGWIFATPAIASVFALLVGGQMADRYFASERYLALSHLIGGLSMIALAFQKSFWPFFAFMAVHQLVYVPTLSVTNSICFHHIKDSKQFGRVRLWGTIGWIAASWPFVFLLKDVSGPALESALTWIFWVAGAASLLLAAYSLTLPHTPPSGGTGEKNAPFEAMKLLAVPAIGVLFVATFLDALVHQCYFQWTSPFLSHIGVKENWIMPAMSIGQIAEIGTMAVLGTMIARLGWRRIMILGILAHAFRFFVYSIGEPVWLVILSNVVHGVCYAFFFGTVYIFVDEYFPKDTRASAQGLFNLLILGIGPFVGSQIWGRLGDSLSAGGASPDFHELFLYPAGLGLLAAILLWIGFHPKAAPSQAAA